MKAIIIEDELNVREGFRKLLATFCPEIDVVGVAGTVETGLEILTTTDIDMLFLDINLPDGSGFDLIYRLPSIDFNLIFVTAYDQYALDAFKVSALDYLLKPVSPDQLKKAVAKVFKQPSAPSQSMALPILQDRLEGKYDQEEKIILSDNEGWQLIAVRDIVYLEASSSYTHFHVQDGRRIMTSSHLKEYERILSPYGFIRCHHSILVNMQHVKSVNKTEGGSISTTNNQTLPLSKRKKPVVIESLKNRFLN